MKYDIFHPPVPTTQGERFAWQNLHGASLGLALSEAVRHTKRPMLIIAADSLTVSYLKEKYGSTLQK